MSARPGMGLSLVMPVFNEAAHLAPNVEQTLLSLRGLGPLEIILVNDGSRDGSGAEMDRLVVRYPQEVRAVHLPHRGKGAALREGARAARGEFVVFLDADLDLPPEQVLFFVAIQRARQADAVIGSKLHPDSTVHYPWRRRLYSHGYYVLVKFLFSLPVRDTQTGLKLVRRDLLLAALEKTADRGFTLDLELLVRLVQLRAVIVEAPVVVNYRMKFGGIGLGTVWQIFSGTWRLWWRVRQEKKTGKPARSIGPA